MTYSLWFLGWIVTTVGLCTLHLGLGFWVGNRFGRSGNEGRVLAGYDALARVREMLIPPTAIAERLQQQASELSLAQAVGRAPSMSASLLTEALQQVLASSVSLSDQLQALQEMLRLQMFRLDVESSPTVAAPLDDHSTALSPLELQSNVSVAKAGESTATVTQAYSYATFQFVAPFGGIYPRRFVKVQCQQLSSSHICFFQDEEPTFDSVVISVGRAPDLLFFVAHIEYCRPAEPNSPARFIVQCRFTRRLNDLYRWHPATDSVEVK